MLSFTNKGGFKKTFKFFERSEKISRAEFLDVYGRKGVEALRSVTPERSGATANSWYYTVSKSLSGYKLTWRNSNIEKGENIAILIQYGHGTGTGGYVQGRDYINPAIRPIFDEMAEILGKEIREA